MLQVFCNLEKRDMDHGMVDGTLSDAAPGLSILLFDLAERVEAVKAESAKLYDLVQKG